MTDYPFLVKGRVKKVTAFNYRNALDRILSKNLNIFIQTKHARKMDLITASEQAQKESKLKKNTRFYVVSNIKTGEVDFSTIVKVTEMAQAVFVNGKMDKLTEEEKQQGRVPDKGVPAPTNSGKAVLTPEQKAARVEKTRTNVAKILESNKKITNVITKAMAKTATKAQAAAKKAAPAKTNKMKAVGGKATAILEVLKKKPSTLAELSKAVDTSEVNVKWYISKLRGDGNDITIDGVKCTLKK